jgi:acetyl esterase
MAVTLPPLAPAARALAEQMALAKPLHECSIAEARATAAAATPLLGQGPELAQVATLSFASLDGAEVPARLYSPAAPAGYLVYLHGGGWVVGDLDGFDALARRLAAATGWAVLMPDYRLAPEHPYPAAVLDADAAMGWARRQADAAGLPLAVAGDSAGGNLAAVVALRARDRGEALAAQLLVYPVVDHDLGKGGSYDEPAAGAVLSAQGMAWFWNHYAPDAERRREPEASPLRAETLEGVAPTLVMTAGYDPLRDDGEAYAARLAEAGVPLVFRRFADQAHGFFSFTNVLPAADEGGAFFAAALQFLTASFAPSSRAAASAPLIE